MKQLTGAANNGCAGLVSVMLIGVILTGWFLFT